MQKPLLVLTLALTHSLAFGLGCTNDSQPGASIPAGQITANVNGGQFKANEIVTDTTHGGTLAYLLITDDPVLSIWGFSPNGDMISLTSFGVHGPGSYPLRSLVMTEDSVVSGGSQGFIIIAGDTATTNDIDTGVLTISQLDTSKSRRGNLTATFSFTARTRNGVKWSVTNGVANKVWLSYY